MTTTFITKQHINLKPPVVINTQVPYEGNCRMHFLLQDKFCQEKFSSGGMIVDISDSCQLRNEYLKFSPELEYYARKTLATLLQHHIGFYRTYSIHESCDSLSAIND